MKIPRRLVLEGGLGVAILGAACAHTDSTDEEGDDMSQIYSDVRPCALRASAVVTANSDAEVSASPLTNGSGEPMEIHEFIFSVRPVNENIRAYSASGLFPSGGQFAVGLAVKDGNDFGYALTNGQIPLWSFGKAWQLGEEEKVQTLYNDTNYDTSGLFLTSVYKWKLDHPLFVPPGARIIPVVRALGSFNGDVEFGITALGKVFPNSPPSRASYKAPWVCAYLSKSFQINEEGNDTSNDNALWNPFPDKDVTIERFVGRLHMFSTSDIGFAGTSIQALVQDTSALDCSQTITGFDYNSGNNYFSRALRIRMRDSMGNPLVRNKTLFRSVFESATRTWETRQVLPPRQLHKIDIYKDAAPDASANSSSRVQVSIASVGWREVSWKRA